MSCGATRGSAKCSELPTDMPVRALEPIRNERVRRAPRSDCTRPSRNAKEGAFITPASEALVPPLGAPPPLRK